MRDLDECTAEVFRRSEKRIKERKRSRNRALALCIPVCLIVAVWSAMSLPAMPSAGETSGLAPFDGAQMGNAPASPVCPYTAVEIQEAGPFPEEYSGKVTDTAAVAEMFCAIYSLFADADGNDQDTNEGLPACDNFPEEKDRAYYDQAQSISKSKVYTITFTAEDGSQTVYILSENTLVNVSANETVFLGDFQVAGLLAVLGISE